MEENGTENSNQWEALLEKVETDIAEYEKKVQPLKITRNYLRGLLELPIVEIEAFATSETKNHTGTLPTFRNGDFYEISYTEAGYQVLERAGGSLTVNEIFKIIKGTGREIAGKDPIRTLYSSLVRSRKLVLVAKNTFDLAERRPKVKRVRRKKPEGEIQTETTEEEE